MSVKKFSSFNKASQDLWILEPDPEYYENLKELFDFWSKLSNRKIIRGFHKFETYEKFIKFKQEFD